MEDFQTELLKPVFLFVLGFIMGVIKAFLRKSPLSKKEEFIEYHKYLKKPVIWGFIIMFAIVVIFGFPLNENKIEVIQKAVIAGLYASAGIYIFMIWGANLIRGY